MVKCVRSDQFGLSSASPLGPCDPFTPSLPHFIRVSVENSEPFQYNVQRSQGFKSRS